MLKTIREKVQKNSNVNLNLISDVNIANKNLKKLLGHKHLTIVKKTDVMEIDRRNEKMQRATHIMFYHTLYQPYWWDIVHLFGQILPDKNLRK